MNQLRDDDTDIFRQSGALAAVGFHGCIAEGWLDADLLSALARLPALLDEPGATIIAGGRNRHVRVSIDCGGRRRLLLVKSFGRQPWWKDVADHYRGSKAKRSWLAASHLADGGVATPRPVAWLERRDGFVLCESYFITEYVADSQDLNRALVALFRGEAHCHQFNELLEPVARVCRKMHDAGFVHRDLGNQNLLIPRSGGPPQIIDLNRGRLHPQVSMRRRGKDLSRLDLPWALMKLFLDMYWGGMPPRELSKWTRFHRTLFALWAKSRVIRHPVRETRLARERQQSPEPPAMPSPADMWIWDERTAQAFNALGRWDRFRLYPADRWLSQITATFTALPGLWPAYRETRQRAFAGPVTLTNRIGVAIDPRPETFERDQLLLADLGKVPVSIRLYHHEPQASRDFRLQAIRQLAKDGHEIKACLVQDRRGVRDPRAWARFADDVLSVAGRCISIVEVGHAINRVKWGIWGFRELEALYRPLPALKHRFPHIDFVGPATIDFEYPFALAALKRWPNNLALAAFSHHLYVDRRGAPENTQGGFDALDKFALAQTIARRQGIDGGRVIVSEVNWPLAGNGEHSPIAPPWLADGGKSHEHGVNETTYCAWMLRYLILALGSGFVDRVYWWRMVARGYGLLDENDQGEVRPRKAWYALCYFLDLLGEAAMTGAEIPATRQGRYRVSFLRPDGDDVDVVWAHGEPAVLAADPSVAAFDMTGQRLDKVPQQVTGQPVYLRRPGRMADQDQAG